MKRPTILLIDDSELVLKAVTQYLTTRGLYVVTTTHPKIGRDLAKGLDELVAIVLDVDMPEVDGGTLSESLREIPKFRNVPIIFYSGLRKERTDRLISQLSATSLVSKTDGVDALWTEIQRVTAISPDSTKPPELKSQQPEEQADDLLLDEIFDGLFEEVREPVSRATARPIQPVEAKIISKEDADDESVHTRATVRPPDADALASSKFRENK